MLGGSWCNREAAVSPYDGGNAVPARGGQGVVPENLGVVVGVKIDEARRHEHSRGVE